MRKFNKALSVLLIIAVLLGIFSPSTPYLSEKLWHRNEQSAQLQTYADGLLVPLGSGIGNGLILIFT